ncbi:hypothetical protein [Collimonas silvisoli]|uniref:hypothetical protein n=1 Tax=Collimonas silvisoli TaxID=2825884 RepID=UPI001B8BD738|nr:hypothetical protein [Collimonas silvisoli]
MPDISAPDVKAALAQILASGAFSKAQRMSRLLQFLIEKRVAGAVRDTNEYTIGIEVFDRDPAAYNTSEDPIVRVQIGRLRKKLCGYYTASGNAADLIFSIPVGSYMPEIRRAGTADSSFKHSHMLAILPLRCITTDAPSVSFAEGLSEELSFQLFKEFGNKIVSYTFAMAERANASDVSRKIEKNGVSHLLEGSIRVEGEFIRLSFRLVDAAAGCIAWSEQFDRHASLAISLQEELAFSICEALKHYFSHG